MLQVPFLYVMDVYEFINFNKHNEVMHLQIACGVEHVVLRLARLRMGVSYNNMPHTDNIGCNVLACTLPFSYCYWVGLIHHNEL